MGRPKGSKNKPKAGVNPPTVQRLTRDPKPKKICTACGKKQSVSNYYRSFNSELHKDGFLPYCKECVIVLPIDQTTGEINFEKLRDVLRQCDRPWDEVAFDAAKMEVERDYNDKLPPIEKSKIALTKLWKNVQSLPQYRMSWQEYEDKKRIKAAKSSGNAVSETFVQEPVSPEDTPVVFDDEEDEFEVTPEIRHRWGTGYTLREYRAFEGKYNFLSQSYANYSALHQEALLNYCRFKVKEELATATGDVDAASSWSSLAMKAAASAKINPSQIAEESDGGFSFAEFNAAIERASDVVRILPKFKMEARDSVDICIYVYINYAASLMGKPPLDYEDVYKFYDEAVKNYIDQYGDTYGIFKPKNNPTVRNRQAVEKFVNVPKDSQASYFSEGMNG